MNELALFAGAGGGILGGLLLGWRTVCAVEIDQYAAGVLAARQNDGCLQPFPIWNDIKTFDGRPWRGVANLVSGGFPCQDVSCAGKGAGITGARSGLWKEMARIVGEVRPQFVWVENSPMLVRRGLGVVLGDLAALGFDAEWGIVSAENAGAPHRRKRIWILAYSARDEQGREEQRTERERTGKCGESIDLGDANGARCEERRWTIPNASDSENAKQDGRRDWLGRRGRVESDVDGSGAGGALWWESKPDMGGASHGLA